MPRLLEAAVKFRLDMFPDLIAVRLEYDAAANRRIIHQVRFFDHIDIPAGKILPLRGYFRYELFLLVCH
ncbi:hypothetical protein D1872_314830 [compost metagenome]